MVIDSNTFKEKFRKFFDLLEKASLKITPFTLSLYPILINKLTNISLDPKLEQFLISFFGSGLVTLIDDYFIKNKSNKELRNKLIEIVKEIENIANQNIKFNEEIFKLNKDILKEEIIIQLMEELNLDVNSLKDQIKEKLDDIQDELRVLTDIELPKIEKFLEKDNELYNEPKLFRKQGPLWIDFNSGYVYEHPIINEIIKKLENENLIVIKGKPASGKTTILKNIGYELSKKYWDVYYIDLKTFQKQRLLEINKLKHGLIIIDDAHLDIGLIEDIFNNKPNIKLLIGTRDIDIEKIRGPTGGGKFSEYLKDSIEIKAIDYADKIINIFEEHKKNKKISDKIKNELTKNNIWILAWQLETFDKYGNIGEESFYKTIRNHITTINNGETGENILIPLSFFYSYEISVRRDYLKKLYRGNISTDSVNKDIDQLKNLNEIKDFLSDKKDYLALHHSEVAKIYFNTFKYFIDFGNDIKEKIDEKLNDYNINKNDKNKYELYFLIDYIEKYPDEFNNWIYEIENSLQYKLIKNDKFIKYIPKIFENMTSLNFICYFDIYKSKLIPLINKKNIIKKEINNINFNFFEDKIRNWDYPLEISYLLKTLKEINYSKIDDLIERFDTNFFEDKIRNWDNPSDISSLLRTLKEINYSKIDDFELKLFEDKIRNWDYPSDISSLLRTLKEINYSKIDDFELKLFEDKIRNWDDPLDISSLLETLKEINYSKINDLIERFDTNFFEEKIRNWDDPYAISSLLKTLKKINYSKINDFELKLFEDKIRNWDYPSDISYLLETLKEINYSKIDDFELKLFEDKIRNWDKLFEISFLLDTLKEINYSKINDLIERFDTNFFEDKIRNWCNPSGISFLLRTLKEINYSKIDDLIEKLDPNFFEEKIRNWDDPYAISSLLKTLKEINYSKIDDLIERFDLNFFEEKIRNWRNPLGISSLLETLKEINYSKINDLIERFDTNFFEDKIRNWDAPSDISYLLETLKEINYSKIDDLIERFDTNFFEDKIRNWDNPLGISYLLEALKEINYSKIDDLIERFDTNFFEDKIRNWRNPSGISSLLETLKEINYSKIDDFELKLFEDKIKNWDDPSGISSLLRTLKEINYSKIDDFELKLFEDKIRNLDDLYDISYLLDTLKEINYSKINDLIEKLGLNLFEEKIKNWSNFPNLNFEFKEKSIKNLEQTLKYLNFQYLEELKEKLKKENLWFIN